LQNKQINKNSDNDQFNDSPLKMSELQSEEGTAQEHRAHKKPEKGFFLNFFFFNFFKTKTNSSI